MQKGDTVVHNPFTPTFGIVPPQMAGRQAVLADMRMAFARGLGDPNLSTLIVGTRGSGKTALLSCIANEAAAAGWISVHVVPSSNMLEDIVQRTVEAASALVDTEPKKRLTSLGLGQLLEVGWTESSSVTPNWRSRMNALFKELAAYDIGLLVTVDEVRANVDEVIELAATYQLFIREGKKVALVMAGLPGNVSSLLSNENVSFLRRSRQRHLGRIASGHIREAFYDTVADAGKQIGNAALDAAVEASGGFPYMMQLVGYHSWQAGGGEREMTPEHVNHGALLAYQDLCDDVLANIYRELSPGDRRFLVAMLPDSGPSRLSDVAVRLGKGTNYASTYKNRLVMQGVIGERLKGGFGFDLPYFKEYLQGKLDEQW